jgi:uncharacterized protein (TIGR00375 family)
MKIVADLHLHSKYSRAVSRDMNLPTMAAWADKKGIDLLATGDFTHPLYFNEIKSQLKEVREGVFGLKKDAFRSLYILSTELSCIYSQDGATRRIHVLVFAPSFQAVEKINDELKARGFNVMSDGRPILGLSARDLTELVFSADERALVIPAHIWTPWFSLYGSKSGFDSIEECFGEFADRIYAVETGLSSDPAMNWRVKELEGRSILSFGDAHSPAKLGREATIFQIKNKPVFGQAETGSGKLKVFEKFSFEDLARAIKQDKDSDWEISYTVEFYPEEGKYHYTGHRNCGVVQSPNETKKKGSTCPVCGRSLTVGVMHRVEELAGHNQAEVNLIENKVGLVGYYPKESNRPPYVMLVPLAEILSEVLGVGVNTKTVSEEYERLIIKFGSEFNVLIKTSLQKISDSFSERLAEAIGKVRKGDIYVAPGFDGEFGKVKVWKDADEQKEQKEQMMLF